MPEIFIGNIKGEKGDVGTSLKILNYYTTLEELSSAVSNPNVGDAYGVGSSHPYQIYIYSENKGWVNNGALQPDINEQTPNYAEATTLTSLTSGEKISIAFGKIKKAITDLISHLADTTKHITSTERTAWNGKAPGKHGLGAYPEPYDENMIGSIQEVLRYGSGFYQVDRFPDNPTDNASWKPMLQLALSDISGVQLLMPHLKFDGNEASPSPKMILRSVFESTPSDWVEMLHTGNIEDYRHKIVTGAYTGDGTAPRKIPLDFTPDIVLVFGKSGMVSFLTPQNGYRGCGGMAFKNFPCKVGDTATIEIVDGGFNVAYIAPNGDATVNVPMTNESNAQYYYMAIRQPIE